MIANVIMAAFLSVASFLMFLKRRDKTGRACYFVFTFGFAQMAVQFATNGRNQPVMIGLSLIVVGMGWVLLDAYGRLEWSKRR